MHCSLRYLGTTKLNQSNDLRFAAPLISVEACELFVTIHILAVRSIQWREKLKQAGVRYTLGFTTSKISTELISVAQFK